MNLHLRFSKAQVGSFYYTILLVDDGVVLSNDKVERVITLVGC